jgi:hypothetical protein
MTGRCPLQAMSSASNAVDAAVIHFNGEDRQPNRYGLSSGVLGEIDRVSGHMNAMITKTGSKNDPKPVIGHFDVLCKATGRVF